MLAAFVGPVPLAKAAGVPVVQVTRALHSGKPSLHAQMRLERLQLEDLHQCALLNSKGATIRLRALYATGYTTPILAEMLETGHRQVGEILSGERAWVRGVTHRKSRALFQGLQMAPEPEGAWADNARTRALHKGWLKPIELEEDLIDIPEPWASQALALKVEEMSYADKASCMRAVRNGERSELIRAGYEAYKIEYRQRRNAREMA